MNSNKTVSLGPGWRRLCLIASLGMVVVCSSYCTTPDSETSIAELSPDETYLADAYVQVVVARDVYSISHLKSDSLFAALESTIDTLRIANTIRDLNRDPDRWLLVYQFIERRLKTSSQGQD